MAERSKSLRWRQKPRPKGLSAIGYGYRGYELRLGDECLATVGNLDRWGTGKFYWYGCGVNTASQPVDTEDEAKAQALEYVKKHLATKVA